VTFTVAVVGIGEDGVAGLRPDAREVVEAADVLVGGERHQRLVPTHPAERIVFKRDAARLASQVQAMAGAGRHVVVLASGDPMFFGIGPVLAYHLGAERVRIYPNVSAVQLAFARLGEAWQDAVVLSAHGRALEPVVEEALRHARLAILTDQAHTPAAIAWALVCRGMEPTARAWCMERLGGPSERIQRGTLADCADWTSDPLNLLVILRDPTHVRGRPLRLGLPDETYVHKRGQITKAEIRAISLARLAPRPGDIVWDIGAGSGSVGLEAAALCQPSGAVYAVERRPEQQACIRENVQRFGGTNLHLVDGEAPGVLVALPDPDAVFVGGTGGHLEPVLELSLLRLRPAGRLVLNLATLQSLHTVSAFLGNRGVPYDMAQISVARGVSLGEATRLAPLNPVFIVSAQVASR